MVIVHTIVMTSSQRHCRWDSASSWMRCIDHTRCRWGLKQVSSVMWWLWWDEGRVLARVKLPESDSWTRFKPELDLCLVGIFGVWSELNLMGAAMLPAPKSRTSSFWSSLSWLTLLYIGEKYALPALNQRKKRDAGHKWGGVEASTMKHKTTMVYEIARIRLDCFYSDLQRPVKRKTK
jgi:hypothetical protein